jgi:hypothetical protein
MKVAIVGAAPSSRGLAPFDDPDWKIWTCSPGNRIVMKRVDAWFELHALIDLESERWKPWVTPYSEYLRTLTCPVYMQGETPLVPGAKVFPANELVAEFGSNFFTSSVAWMIAFAIRSGAREIAIYGVDMEAGSEYDYERPGCQYFIQEARKRGITVTIPPQSSLGAPVPLYGYGDANPIATKLKEHCYELRGRIAGLDQKLADLDAERANLTNERAHLQGAIEENIYMRRSWLAWSGPDP